MKGLRGGEAKTQTQTKKLKVSEARPILENMEMERLLESIDIPTEAIKLAEESGIVFIDEIDKICSVGEYLGADASAEGVQRDMLPLIEGSVIETKHGKVATDHMLFVCSGAFHNCKPADLLPELQGRLPIRVELQGLKEEDLYRILTEPEVSLIKQQQMLLGTEGVKLTFEDDAIKEIAKVAFEMNTVVENIGARRLHTVMEKISDEFSFEAADMEEGTEIVVDVAMVQQRLKDALETQDLQKFIL
jgi:ATP-dependent HslUV protease ATP-binding subunit HslU